MKLMIRIPLMTLCAQLQRSGVRLTTLALTALSPLHVAQLTADTLRMPVTGCASLSGSCHEKNHGNPFFLNQFLAAIYDRTELNNAWLVCQGIFLSGLLLQRQGATEGRQIRLAKFSWHPSCLSAADLYADQIPATAQYGGLVTVPD